MIPGRKYDRKLSYDGEENARNIKIYKVVARKSHISKANLNVFVTVEDCINFLEKNGAKGNIEKSNINFREEIKCSTM